MRNAMKQCNVNLSPFDGGARCFYAQQVLMATCSVLPTFEFQRHLTEHPNDQARLVLPITIAFSVLAVDRCMR